MSAAIFDESSYENAIIELLVGLGYTHLYGPDVDRDYHNPLLMDIFVNQIRAINPQIPYSGIEEAINKVTQIEHGTLIQQNKIFTDYLQNGVPVQYTTYSKDCAGTVSKNDIVKLIDYVNPENNSFVVVNQWTVIEFENKRPDIVIFVNGLPLAVVELKSCMNEDVGIENGYRQLRNYMKLIPSLFIYNAFCIISDLSETKAGTISSGFDRYAAWKTIDGDYENTQYAQYNVLFEGMFGRQRFLDILQNFILFSTDTPNDIKILAAYHQYFAVKKAVDSTLKASLSPLPLGGVGGGRGGVVWHTQGSGKSLSMVFYAGLLCKAMQSPTIVVITDRNDLDNQLFEQFASCKDFLRQTPVQAESRKNLYELLNGREANGIFFTTMQKFEETNEPLSERKNIIVIADEAHRSQYGLSEKIKADGKIVIGDARKVRDSLPNAIFIGFTGTPVASKDHNTREVFGDYIDVYDMTQSVEDGATKPVFYESRVINLGLKPEILQKIDETYELLALDADEKDIERSKRELGNMEAILGSPETIDSLCSDIIQHCEENREQLLTGKAMMVAYSRAIGLKIYHRMLELRPLWKEKVQVVMTAANNDPEDWQEIIGNKSHKKVLARRFKDNNDPMKIAIVVDMWLTGFDVPSLATMYVFKAMSGHNLMQAIARVNRVFKDKEGGLVVDYIGIASALKQAMNEYTKRDKSNYGDMDIAKTALPKFREKLQVCRELFHGFDYTAFMDDTSTDKVRADLIKEGINFVLGKDESEQKLFQKEALLLKQARSLCQSMLKRSERFESTFFEAIRISLNKFTSPQKLSFKEINEQISELLKQSIKSEGVRHFQCS
ncbi:MAG: type I restriction endonuclease subunit R [Spirochaetaceae bacterium]|jgi:type I restriction enzyme R subunit|nr:type I restriction endonuclease subunit R [Spirochaetaceae bacterium]